mgnify:CR=1 FL=1
MSACYLCGSDTEAGVFVHNATRTRTPWVTIACHTCGLIQHRDHPDAASLNEYYRSGAYRREFPPVALADGIGPESTQYPATRALWGDAVTAYAETALGPLHGRRVYEVGAGDCAVALAMARRGASVTVIEPDASVVPEGVDALPALPDPMPPASLVVAFQVLEHQADPVEALRDWLRAETVYVEVPNARKPYGSLTYFLQWPHVVTFSPLTLGMCALMAGANDVDMNEPETVLSARMRGRGPRRTWAEVAAMVRVKGGAFHAAELRGAFA